MVLMSGNKTDMTAFNKKRETYVVLGALCKEPSLLNQKEVTLTPDDFLQEIHKIIFMAIHNLIKSDVHVNKITASDIDNYLNSYPNKYAKWKEMNAYEYMEKSINSANPSVFMVNYSRLKKYSLLRYAVESGIGIEEIYNYEETDFEKISEQVSEIDETSVEELMDRLSMKFIKFREGFEMGTELNEFKVGDDVDSLLAELQETPDYGLPFRNLFYNHLFRGMNKGRFYLRSADTGGGKTRQSLADLCTIAFSEFFDYQKGWISTGECFPVLFISTELNKRELQQIILSHITGISGDVIKDGKYTGEIKERVIYGLELMKQAEYYFVHIDDFSVGDIQAVIEKYIIKHNIEYIAFDYIQMTAKLSRTTQKLFETNMRPDEILLFLATELKKICDKYNVFMVSSTQLNRNGSDVTKRNASSLSGGSATATKIDVGMQSFPVLDRDLKDVQHIVSNGFNKVKPNFAHWIYKNRLGRDNVIVWTNLDLDTTRETALFVTDFNYKLLPEIKLVSINESGISSETINVHDESEDEDDLPY